MQQILTVPVSAFSYRLPYGFIPGVELFDELPPYKPDDTDGPVQFRDRDPMETDPTYKQIVSYNLVTDGRGRFLSYYRPKTSGEQRLRGQRSIGIGGHVDLVDAPGDFSRSVITLARMAAIRELIEEIGSVEAPLLRLLGGLNHDDTPVASVHLGVVHLAIAQPDLIRICPDELMDVAWLTTKELQAGIGEFEYWSQMLIRWLVGAELHGYLVPAKDDTDVGADTGDSAPPAVAAGG